MGQTVLEGVGEPELVPAWSSFLCLQQSSVPAVTLAYKLSEPLTAEVSSTRGWVQPRVNASFCRHKLKRKAPLCGQSTRWGGLAAALGSSEAHNVDGGKAGECHDSVH